MGWPLYDISPTLEGKLESLTNECAAWHVVDESVSSSFVSEASSSSRVAVCRDASQWRVKLRLESPRMQSSCGGGSAEGEATPRGRRSRKERALMAQYVKPANLS